MKLKRTHIRLSSWRRRVDITHLNWSCVSNGLRTHFHGLLTHHPVLKSWMILLKLFTSFTWSLRWLSFARMHDWIYIFLELWTVLLLRKWLTGQNMFSPHEPRFSKRRRIKNRLSFPDNIFWLMLLWFLTASLCDNPLPTDKTWSIIILCSLWDWLSHSFVVFEILFAFNGPNLFLTFSGIFINPLNCPFHLLIT